MENHLNLEMCPIMGMDNITTHVFPSEEGRKLKYDHPTNDP
jgi:hypothetical protein